MAYSFNDFKNKLISLNHNNPLYNIKKNKSSYITENIYLLEDLFDGDKTAEIVKNAISDIKEEKETAKTLDKITKTAKNNEDETGLPSSFIVYGFLEHEYDEINDKYKKNTPIILIPVNLEKSATKLKITLIDEDISENQTFLKRLNEKFNYKREDIKEFDNTDSNCLNILTDHLNSLTEELKRLNIHNENIRINTKAICLTNLTNEQNLLYQDISKNLNEYHNSSNLKKLFEPKDNNSSDSDNESASDYSDYLALPDSSKIYDFHPILDADSSQMKVIFNVINMAQNSIIQGPPGTGKSQTIANILVELMQQGKKVLFVSEKAVATQVVYDRIKAVNTNLANRCLMLHSTKMKSINIVKSVNTTLDTINNDNNFEINTYFLKKLIDKKEILNKVHKDLHNTYFKEIFNEGFRKKGFNIYQLNSLIIKLENKNLIPLNCKLNLKHLTSNNDTYQEMLEDLKDENENFAKNNFYTSAFKSLLPETSVNTKHIEKLTNYLHSSETKLTKVYNSQVNILDNFKPYLNYDAILLDNFDSFKNMAQELKTKIKNIQQLLVSLKEQSNAITKIQEENFSKNLFELKPVKDPEINTTFTLKSSIFTKLLNRKTYKNIKELLIQYSKSLHQAQKIMQLDNFTTFSQSNITWEKITNLLQNELSIVGNIITKKKWEEVNKYFLEDVSLQQLNTTEHDINLFEIYLKEVNLVKNIYQLDTTNFINCKNSINDVYNKSRGNYKLQNILKNEELSEYKEFFNLNELYKNDCTNMQESNTSLNTHKNFINKKYNLENKYKLSSFFQKYFEQPTPRGNLQESLELNIYQHMLNNIEQEKPLDITNISQDISKFKNYEEKYFNNNPKRILSNIQDRELNDVLNTENNSSRRYFQNNQTKSWLKISCRKMVKNHSNYLHTLFPIWVMSPLSVVKFIEADMKFDLVIFDEGSQIRVENSLAALTRAKKFVIAGDTQQMPPSNMFIKSNDDDYDEEADLDTEDTQSILSFATAKLINSNMLDWHYRSKYEQLIKPSNHECYRGNLITMPSIDATIFPIEHIFVEDGVWYGKKEQGIEAGNLKEVEKIIELLPKIIKQHPEKKIGIITFGAKQSNLIDEQLQIKLSTIYNKYFDASNENKKGFIKTLENCQGDEADIVIISVSYGKNKDGNFIKRFGPIDGTNGFKRLNVAFSRTREKVYLISSFKANDLGNLGEIEGDKKGKKFLQNYLKYAEEQSSINIPSWETKTDSQITESPFEEVVKQKLQNLGYNVRTQIGHGNYRIDLAILDNNTKKYILGIECDGATYHSSESARDRDRLRQKKLEDDGWKIHRIWSTNWKNNPEQELDKIKLVVESLTNNVSLTNTISKVDI